MLLTLYLVVSWVLTQFLFHYVGCGMWFINQGASTISLDVCKFVKINVYKCYDAICPTLCGRFLHTYQT